MCGYDPFYWYEWELDRQYEAFQAGFDNYEDYFNDLESQLENDAYDRYADDRAEEAARSMIK